MKKFTQFLKSSYLIVIGIAIGATVLTVGALSIPTNIDNSIQTIKTIYISSDGVSTTGENVFVKIDNTSGATLTVKGNMTVGDKTNTVSGNYSSVAGGWTNNVDGNQSNIVGGKSNNLFGDQSNIAGGFSNKIKGNNSNILGGESNVLTGKWSTIAGGSQNNISGDYSFAAGAQNFVVGNYNTVFGRYVSGGTYDGSFVWSDGYTRSAATRYFTPIDSYTFIIRAYNGVAIGTGATLGMTSLRVWDGTTGRIAAKEYCDENGTGCIDASALITFGTGSGGGSTGVNYWTANGSDIYNNNTGYIAVGTSAVVSNSLAGLLQLNGSIGMINGTDRFIKIYQGKGCITGSNLNIVGANGSQFACFFHPVPMDGGNVTVNGGAGDGGGAYGDVILANAGGKVGIVTTAPTEALDVSGSVRIRSISQASTANNVLVTDTTGEVMYATFASVMSGNGYRGKNGSNIYNTNTGYVGIGTASPSAALQVSGNVILGKTNNIISSASSLYSTILGGELNVIATVSPYSSIVGGSFNYLRGQWSALVGGEANRLTGNYSFIGGGSNNRINGIASTIVGGGYYVYGGNTVIGNVSFLGGGSANIIRGDYSVIPGGLSNQLSGDYSFAAGNGAVVNHDKTFVWAGGVGGTSSAIDQQFVIRADNGVGIGTNLTTGAALTVRGGVRLLPTFPPAPDTLPACTLANEGTMVYGLKPATLDRHFYGCNGTDWKQLDN